MSDNVVSFKKKDQKSYTKICRNGECFWVEAPIAQLSDTCIGIVASELVGEHPYKRGDVIEFKNDEIVERVEQ